MAASAAADTFGAFQHIPYRPAIYFQEREAVSITRVAAAYSRAQRSAARNDFADVRNTAAGAGILRREVCRGSAGALFCAIGGKLYLTTGLLSVGSAFVRSAAIAPSCPMVGMSGKDRRGAVKLLDENDARKAVWKGQGAE